MLIDSAYITSSLIVSGSSVFNGNVTITGSLDVSGSAVYFRTSSLPLGETNTNSVLVYNSNSGRVYYTASSAIGGGGSGNGFPFTGVAQITGSLIISASDLTSQSFTSIGVSTITGSLIVSNSLSIIGNQTITGSLTVSGSITGSLFGTASYASNSLTASYALSARAVAGGDTFEIQFNSGGFLAGTSSFTYNTSGSFLRLTGSFIISSSNSSSLLVYGSGSITPVFSTVGSLGTLMSVTDVMSGSIFSVRNVSGIPIFRVFSNNELSLGDYDAPALLTTTRTSINDNNTATTIFDLNANEYTAIYVDYTAESGSNSRTGKMIVHWNTLASILQYTNAGGPVDIGTPAITFSASLASSVVTISATATGGTGNPYTAKTIIRSI